MLSASSMRRSSRDSSPKRAGSEGSRAGSSDKRGAVGKRGSSSKPIVGKNGAAKRGFAGKPSVAGKSLSGKSLLGKSLVRKASRPVHDDAPRYSLDNAQAGDDESSWQSDSVDEGRAERSRARNVAQTNAFEKEADKGTSPFKQSLEKIRAAIAPVILARRVEMVELAWVTEPAGRTLRLTIERSGVGPTLKDQLLVGFGVSLEDCADVSRDVSAALDAADVVPHAYMLEVSSPGLDRPLRHVADFVRFVGQTAKIKLREPAKDGQRVLRGRLREVTGYDSADSAPHTRIAIEVDGKLVELTYDKVESANLVYELATQAKPSARPAGQSSDKARGNSRDNHSRDGHSQDGHSRDGHSQDGHSRGARKPNDQKTLHAVKELNAVRSNPVSGSRKHKRSEG